MIAIDLDDKKLKLANQFGANQSFNLEKELIDVTSILDGRASLSKGACRCKRLYDKKQGLNKEVVKP